MVGPEGETWPVEQRLRYAQNVTQMRLDYQLRESMAAWRLSQQDKVVRRDSFSAMGELRGWTLTTSNQCGKSSHLGRALNLTLAIARLAGVDVTGKSIRDEIARQNDSANTKPTVPPTAEPAAAESPQDFEQSKPLWNLEAVGLAANVQTKEAVGTTSIQPMDCAETSSAESAFKAPQNGAQNSYETQPAGSTKNWPEIPQAKDFRDEDGAEVEEHGSREIRWEVLMAI